MEKIQRFLATSVLVVLIVCFIGAGNAAAASGNTTVCNPVADIIIGPNGINWHPNVEYKSLVLTVSCPDGTVFRKTFKGGSAVYLERSDDRGNYLSDGSYTYELRVIPIDDNTVRKSPRKTLLQTGYFLIGGSKFVTPKVFKIAPDNLSIVHEEPQSGPECICVGGECHNINDCEVDTIRLYEEDTRILFEDSSTGQNEPTNDWRIIANDSDAGGSGEYFSIQDVTGNKKPFTIEAGASANSLYIDDNGRVGMGTSTPAYTLEMETTSSDATFVADRTDGATAKVAAGSSSTQMGSLSNHPVEFIANNSIKMAITTDGWVGIGTTSPAQPLHLATSSSFATILAERTDGAKAQISARETKTLFGSKTNHELYFTVNNQGKMIIDTDGDAAIGHTTAFYKLQVWNDALTAYGYSDGGAWNTGSSRKFKEKVKDLTADEAMEAFKKLNPIRFYYKGVKEDEHLGFISEDVPGIVATPKRDAVSAMDIVTLLTKVVQEQQKSIQEQKEFLLEQQETITQLKKEMTELKKK